MKAQGKQLEGKRGRVLRKCEEIVSDVIAMVVHYSVYCVSK